MSLWDFVSKIFEFINKVRLIIVAAGEGDISPIVMRCGFNELINLLQRSST